MRCLFEKVDKSAEGNLLRCMRCRRELRIKAEPDKVAAKCRYMDESGNMHRYVHLGDSKIGVVWRFSYLTEEQAHTYTGWIQRDEGDDSKVGQWLKEFLSFWGYKTDASCYCKQLAHSLDLASWKLISENRNFVCDMILRSANSIGENPSQVLVKGAVSLALYKNRPRD